jgi:hypothetical protein
MSFACKICYDDKPNFRRMPQSSLGCGCANEICVECFLKDWDSRRVAIWLDEHGMSQWDNPLELQNVLEEMFETENDTDDAFAHPKFEEFLLANMHVGKKCPFCCQTCVWKLNQVPQILQTTGRLTFYEPCFVQPLPMPLQQ